MPLGSDADKSSYNNSLPSTSAINHINSDGKNMINFQQNKYNNQNIASKLYSRLKKKAIQEVIPTSENQNNINYGMDGKTDESIKSSIEVVEICKNQSMGTEFEDIFDSDKNSDIAKLNLKRNIEFIKKLSENRKNKNGLVNKKKSEFGFNSLSLNSKTNSNLLFHSTLKKENNRLNENHVVPEIEALNIAKILKVYSNGINIENFKFIYNILYNNIFSPDVFGFISIEELFKPLDNMVEVRNNVLYPINEFKFYEQMDLKNDHINKQECIESTICFKNEVHICMNIEQLSLSLNQDKSNIKMVLRKIYNPSLFFLQLCSNIEEFDCLMKQMQIFYETGNKNYLVKPQQIMPGSCYASSCTSFLYPKQWYRLRVIREVNSTTVEIINVDNGTIDYISKTELRFLKHEFCYLPCQAIHCCLTGYNQLDTIAPEVTKAFIEIIDINKEIFVMVDEHFILNNQYQIVHVTLFQHVNISTKLENINNELTIWHLKR